MSVGKEKINPATPLKNHIESHLLKETKKDSKVHLNLKNPVLRKIKTRSSKETKSGNKEKWN